MPQQFIEGFFEKGVNRTSREEDFHDPAKVNTELAVEAARAQTKRDDECFLIQNGGAVAPGPLKTDRPLGSVIIPVGMTTLIHDSTLFPLANTNVKRQFDQSWSALSDAIIRRRPGGKTGKVQAGRGGNPERRCTKNDETIHGKGARIQFFSRQEIADTYPTFARIMAYWRSELLTYRGTSNEAIEEARKTKAALNHGNTFMCSLRRDIMPTFWHERGDTEEMERERVKKFVREARWQAQDELDLAVAKTLRMVHIPKEVADLADYYSVANPDNPNIWSIIAEANTTVKRGFKLRMDRYDLEDMVKTLTDVVQARLVKTDPESIFEMRHWTRLLDFCTDALAYMNGEGEPTAQEPEEPESEGWDRM